MTSTLGRPRHATAHIRLRVAHALAGGTAAAVWLLLPATAHAPGHPVAVPAAVSPTAGSAPVMSAPASAPVVAASYGTARTAAAPDSAEQDGSAVDLALPLVVAVAAVLVAGYGYVRRTRRVRTRTTPAVPPSAPPVPSTGEAERRAREALVRADDCVRASAEELSYVEEPEGGPAREALRAAEAELASAFAIFRRCTEGVPEDAHARRQALVGVVGRCEEAGGRLDMAAAALDRFRGLRAGVGPALGVAERRFRELTARAAGAQGTVAALRERYGVRADEYIEVALDRLVFATARLNETRRAADSGDALRAARQLRAAEGAIAQAGVQVDGVERLASQLDAAAALIPPALAAAEEDPAAPARAEEVLTAVRETPQPYDPLDALRRITAAVRRPGEERAEVLYEAARLVAEAAVEEAADYLAARRGAVGADARTLLAAARQALAATDRRAEYDAEADVLARRARESAEEDVRAYASPYAEEPGHPAGLAGAVLGGVLLGEEPDGGPPVSYGGPGTRDRRRLS
ncbi:hypothetical protein ACWEHT_10565 [Streptomyces sp. NPDC004646]